MKATIERGGTSVEIPLLEPNSRTQVVSRDVGKPNLNIRDTGTINPRHDDFWSGVEQYTLTGKFTDNDAYQKAITLCDLIKSGNQGNRLLLNINSPDYDSDIEVCPSAGADEAVSVAYNPGWKNYVEVNVSLTRVGETVGEVDQQATTPTASGDGPITISHRGDSVTLKSDVTVERSVGRPNSVTRRRPDKYPLYLDKYKTAYDGFEISFEFVENIGSNVDEILQIFSRQLGRESITLDFNGLYGMGAFDVVPPSSQSLRHATQAGMAESGQIPTIQLRRVLGQ